MKKATIIVQDKDAKEALKDLRMLGLLHIEHVQSPQGADINTLQEELALADNSLDILQQFGVIKEETSGIKESGDWKKQAMHIIDSWKRREQLMAFSRSLKNQINEWEAWGDFSPEEVQRLAQKGIYIRLYIVPVKQIKEFPKEAIVKIISVNAGLARCVVIAQSAFETEFKEIALPQHSLSHMRERLSEATKALSAIEEEMKKYLAVHREILAARINLEREIEFHRALSGMGREEKLAYLTGYLPFDSIEKLRKIAKEHYWGIVIREPSIEDNVPTFIRNPRWIALIKPVFKFLEILPGYREIDISLPFLVFFSIFFGMLIGDAGYGLVYLLITFLIQRKMKGKPKQDSSFALFYILSLCAIIWGALTGTFFGQEWFLKAGYKPLFPALNNEKTIQRFCFFLGALHLSIAHGWRAILKAPSLSALGDLGWMCILWSAFFITKTLILGDAFPSFCLWLLISGATLVILFTNPRKNILKSAEEWISWLVTLPFSFISNFADVVSYIRLFAVGLAGIAIADAFNAMAAMIGQGNMLMIVLAAMVALIGNVLGIVLGPVSVLVHGVRLNLLEFSGHMGLSWSGSPYKPLKE